MAKQQIGLLDPETINRGEALGLHARYVVAVGVFDTAMKNFIPRTGNLASIHNVMNMLAAFEPKNQTAIGEVLHSLAGTIRRKGITIVISDLFDDEAKILDGIQHLRF